MRLFATTMVLAALLGCASSATHAPARGKPADNVQLVLAQMGSGASPAAIKLSVDSVGNIATLNGAYLERGELQRVLTEWIAKRRLRGQPVIVHLSTDDESKISLAVFMQAASMLKAAVVPANVDAGGGSVVIRLDVSELAERQ